MILPVCSFKRRCDVLGAGAESRLIRCTLLLRNTLECLHGMPAWNACMECLHGMPAWNACVEC